MDHNTSTRLIKSALAPEFQLKDINNRSIVLKEYADQKLLIGFFRHAGCPFCNIRVHNLSKLYEELKPTGFKMIFFFESPVELISMSTFHGELSPIPIISDPEKVWYAKYGLEPSAYKSAVSHLRSFVGTAFEAYRKKLPMHMMKSGESINTIPAEFLIDRGLKIHEVHYSESLTDRMDVGKIRAFAKG